METTTTVSAVWQKSKLLIKGLIIGVLVLLLLIPAYFVKNLVQERENSQKEAVAEVSSKWASRQIVTGPVLVVPFWQYDNDTNRVRSRTKQYAYFLPDKLEISSEVTPVKKHRGIYSVMLYSAETNVTGQFAEVMLSPMDIREEDIIWNEVIVKIHISDSRGLNNEPRLRWNDTSLVLSSQSVEGSHSMPALTAVLPVTSIEELQHCRFSSILSLKGSEKILFSPVGRMTTVNLRSPWSHPSFTGNSLPDSSTITEDGFSATWKSLAHTRPFPQQWKGNAFTIGNHFPGTSADDFPADTNSSIITASSFGADLFVPVNGYQKTMRSVKYAVLCILLTFTAFFLIETTNKKSVHPVHYALIGFALILFYTLLLSFSEYIGFNAAYGIAALATAGLIAWFVRGLLGSMRLSLLLSLILVLLYSYVFTILQLQDYALLMGSIGLFLTLAIVMRFSRRIQW